MLKKIFIYILCLTPWFLNNILPINYNYFNEINLPFFTPPPLFYSISWTIIYILISISIYNIFISFKFKDINPFLGFISSLGTFISTLFLYEETALIQSKQSKLLIPYILLSLFASILSLTIYIIN